MTTTVRTGDGRTATAKSVSEALKTIAKGGVESVGPSKELVHLAHAVFDVHFHVQELQKPEVEGRVKFTHMVIVTVGGLGHEIKQLAETFDDAMCIIGEACLQLGKAPMPKSAKAARKKAAKKAS